MRVAMGLRCWLRRRCLFCSAIDNSRARWRDRAVAVDAECVGHGGGGGLFSPCVDGLWGRLFDHALLAENEVADIWLVEQRIRLASAWQSLREL